MVQRYDESAYSSDGCVVTDDDGEYVLFTDYESIEKERDGLRAKLEVARNVLADISNRAVRIRENKAIVGVEASFIEREALKACIKIGQPIVPRIDPMRESIAHQIESGGDGPFRD